VVEESFGKCLQDDFKPVTFIQTAGAIPATGDKFQVLTIWDR